MKSQPLDPAILGEIIEMALSDHVSFDQIRALHGLSADEVKTLMRQNLKSGSYRAWRRRVRTFADRREVYKGRPIPILGLMICRFYMVRSGQG